MALKKEKNLIKTEKKRGRGRPKKPISELSPRGKRHRIQMERKEKERIEMGRRSIVHWKNPNGEIEEEWDLLGISKKEFQKLPTSYGKDFSSKVPYKNKDRANLRGQLHQIAEAIRELKEEQSKGISEDLKKDYPKKKGESMKEYEERLSKNSNSFYNDEISSWRKHAKQIIEEEKKRKKRKKKDVDVDVDESFMHMANDNL